MALATASTRFCRKKKVKKNNSRRWQTTAYGGVPLKAVGGQTHPACSGTPLNMFYYVYILKSLKDGSYYVGQTQDLNSRLVKHNLGQSKFTKLRLPYKIIHTEKYQTRNEAVRREIKIKSYKGGNEFKKLINKN